MNNGLDVVVEPGPLDNPKTRANSLEEPETDYGPWMLVSRRRGCGGDGGDDRIGGPRSRAATVNSPDHSVPLTNISKIKNGAACSTHGGTPGLSDTIMEAPILHGKAPIHKDQRVDSPPDTLLEIRMEPDSPIGNIPFPITEVMMTPEQKDYPEETNPNDVVLHPSALEASKGKKSVSAEPSRSPDRLPTLITSKNLSKASESGGPSETHQMIVDTITSSLMYPSIAPDNSDQDMSESEEEEEVLSKNDEDTKPEDQMTLDQYQNSVRKEVLSQKSSQQLPSTHKKGRVASEGVSPKYVHSFLRPRLFSEYPFCW